MTELQATKLMLLYKCSQKLLVHSFWERVSLKQQHCVLLGLGPRHFMTFMYLSCTWHVSTQGHCFLFTGWLKVIQFCSCFPGELRAPISAIAALPMNERKVIAHRAMLMIDRPHAIVNLGIGMPEVHCHIMTVTVDNQYDFVSIECACCQITTCMRPLAVTMKLSHKLLGRRL